MVDTIERSEQASAEIEVTPAMIEAGTRALWEWSGDEVHSEARDVVVDVWKAMSAARASIPSVSSQ